MQTQSTEQIDISTHRQIYRTHRYPNPYTHGVSNGAGTDYAFGEPIVTFGFYWVRVSSIFSF